MGRRTNYGFEKRQKELKRQKKKEAKLAAKQAKKEAAAGDEVAGDGEEVSELEDGAEVEGAESRSE
ncbi:MAG: hypothetical protein R3B81_01650 [bacterium]